MVWVLVWVVLALSAAWVLFLVGRNLFRKGSALAREMSDAADRLAEVSQRLAEQSSSGPRDVGSQGSVSRPQR